MHHRGEHLYYRLFLQAWLVFGVSSISFYAHARSSTDAQCESFLKLGEEIEVPTELSSDEKFITKLVSETLPKADVFILGWEHDRQNHTLPHILLNQIKLLQAHNVNLLVEMRKDRKLINPHKFNLAKWNLLHAVQSVGLTVNPIGASSQFLNYMVRKKVSPLEEHGQKIQSQYMLNAVIDFKNEFPDQKILLLVGIGHADRIHQALRQKGYDSRFVLTRYHAPSKRVFYLGSSESWFKRLKEKYFSGQQPRQPVESY